MQHPSYTRSNIALAGIAACGFVMLCTMVWHKAQGPLNLVDGDGRDYYSYLVSIFIDHNLGHQDITLPYINNTPTGTVNVHTIGVSLLLLPFFGMGYAWAGLFHYEVNGFSGPFQVMLSMGALFYMVLGLWYIKKLLAAMGFKDGLVTVILTLVFLGTNLLNYGLNEPSMSHVYSFALIAAFLYYTRQLMQAQTPKYLYRSALVFGLIMLVRPVNAIALFIVPFWATSFGDFISTLQRIFSPKKLAFSILITSGVLSIQCITWLVQNGRLFQWTQKDDGFYFLNPHPFLMLFGFNSGFFIYTPLCLFLLLGLIPLFRENAYRLTVLVLFLTGLFYLFSSHWAYTYFDGLGIRPMVEYYAVFALTGAYLLRDLPGIKKLAASVVLVLCVCLNLVYCYQFKAGILPPSSMNYDKFKYIFLKTDAGYANALGGCMDPAPFTKHVPAASYSHHDDFAHDPKGCYTYNDHEYGVEYRVPGLKFSSNKVYVKVSLKRKEASLRSSSGSMVAFNLQSPDHTCKHFQACKLNDAPAETCCEWKQYDYAVILNADFRAEDSLTVFVWNRDKQPFEVDDFKVEIYNYNREI